MAMESNNVKVMCEVIDPAGNGQRVTFEQFGLGYDKLLELQAGAVMPCVQALMGITSGWLAKAQAEMGKSASASSTPTVAKSG